MNRKIHIVTRCLVILLLTTVVSSCNKYDKHYSIYEVWVGGVKVTTRNQSDILGDGTVRYEGNRKSGTLILTNANITETIDPDADAVVVSNIPNLTIKLEGDNKIGLGNNAPVNAIATRNLSVTGEGSLALGARASCIKADTLRIESGKIDTYIKTADEEIASFLGVALWAQDKILINGGEISVHYTASFSPLSYGFYSVADLEINGGTIRINPDDSRLMAVGLITSGQLTINGGNISAYGLDDAINAKFTHISGGEVLAQSLDYFADGVCRLVTKAEITGGVFTIADMQHNPKSVKLFSNDLHLNGVSILAGANDTSVIKQEINNYGYTDPYIRIEKEE
ncbi:MAG: carbohydrate-binding domain-containing protein [Paludibacteraceae bacterium]|nr:carbohydrate-binding domain-containing protein [Paludibacteraceae bacterium]